MAVLELGEEARKKAAARVLNSISSWTETGETNHINDEWYAHFLKLAWLADETAYQGAEQMLHVHLREHLQRMRPLFGVSQQPDEGLFLLNVLKDNPDLPLAAQSWIIFRLGDLREKRAVGPLIQDLIEHPWQRGYTTPKALIQIGGPEVEKGVIRLLTHQDHNWVRQQAIDIIYQLQEKKALPLFRRMITEDDFGIKSQAAIYLARIGTPEDLPALLALSDFWKGNREAHYHAMSAIANIRDRYNYDISGPIQMESGV
jgi:hypothetical protein